METERGKVRIAPDQVFEIAPALGRFTDEILFGTVWDDPALSRRDRSLVTLTVLVATGRFAQITSHCRRALDNGLTPDEISELVTHLAFYSGWPAAMSAVPELARAFAERGVSVRQSDAGTPVALDPDAEAARKAMIRDHVAPTAPGLARDTDEVLFADLWRRPQLAPRDRSLVTMAALIATGQAEQLGFHAARAMDGGLSVAEAGEVLRHAAYYAGWPRAMSAVPVLKAVLAARGSAE